ncbi:thioesterase II family protein [Kibdelosporangium persicum]|uniref:Surfactin synthase thioesterase subunit n=1 Tax=Kibdelosporangium persicum TaxID=2698649 RepID=A0ABX2FGH4_9PSEU|nr:alpha/beta fold hydrolase [Kibdelosporangium persicum]NRN70387.1 Surfactin synthase thioesterase subunit [Kibdelosporangium persicum]
MTESPWIRRPRKVPDARIRLFCVPHAGAGPSFYARWLTELSPAVEVCLVSLPGRETRFDEPPTEDLGFVASRVASAAQPLLDRPFALFGHSMGALVAYEVAHRLPYDPEHLFVSGSPPAHLPSGERSIAHLPDAEFLAEVRHGYGGIPNSLWADQDLIRLLLPVLRADFAACERYRWPGHPPLRCDISALSGAGDHYVPPSALAGWADLTSGQCTTRVIGQGHFNLVSDRAAVHRFVRERLGLVPATEGARHD